MAHERCEDWMSCKKCCDEMREELLKRVNDPAYRFGIFAKIEGEDDGLHREENGAD